MSLTSIMRGGLSKEVAKLIPIPKHLFQSSKDCIACPRSKNFSLIGIAFDYLLRSEIKRQNRDAKEDEFIADAGIDLVAHMITTEGSFKAINGEAGDAELGALFQTSRDYHSARDNFLKTGNLTDEFIEKTIKFSRMDTIFRAHYLDDVRKPVDPEDVKDMRALYDIIPSNFVNMGRNIILDATFGEASVMVGGADVDLVFDNTLIEIKTTKDMKLDEYLWAQTVGYMILSKKARDLGEEFPELTEMGIYYSRYGKFWKIDAEYIYGNSNYSELEAKLFNS